GAESLALAALGAGLDMSSGGHLESIVDSKAGVGAAMNRRARSRSETAGMVRGLGGRPPLPLHLSPEHRHRAVRREEKPMKLTRTSWPRGPLVGGKGGVGV
ncbi:unnamed protein product, partial [Discosporangium mesarthrocarpum]